MSTLTLKTRIDKIVKDSPDKETCAKAVHDAVMTDIRLLHGTCVRAQSLMAAYPVRPGPAQELYNALDAVVKQYDPDFKTSKKDAVAQQ